MEPLTLFFKDIKIENILDIGTGSGDFINTLKETFADAKITAVDPDKDSLATARTRFPDIGFSEMVAENLQFNDNSFDLVSISMALHHLNKIRKGLTEMKRVVKPGGWIIINELISDNLNPAQEVHKMYHHFKSRIDRMTGICHRETFTKAAILQMLKTAAIPVQFFFEYNQEINLTESDEELEQRVKKMEEALERIKGRKEYDLMKPEIDTFKEKARVHGFQPATKLVIAGRIK